MPDVPVNMRLDLQNHCLVPLPYFRKLVYLEHLYTNGLLVWRGERPPPDLPPQRTEAPMDAEEEELSQRGPVSTISVSAFMPPSSPFDEPAKGGGGQGVAGDDRHTSSA